MVSGLFMDGRDDTDEHSTDMYSLQLSSVNHCPLHKEISLTESEECTHLQVKRGRFRGQFGTMSIQQNKSTKFISGLWAPQPLITDKIYIESGMFTPVERALNSTRKQLVTSITFTSVFHPWVYLSTLVIIVFHRVFN